MPKMTLDKFVKEVNEISRKECERLNQEYDKGKALFGGCHTPLPVELLKHYHNRGYTPKQTLQLIEEEAMAEAYAESMVS
jgi:hypothetical protein